MRFTHKTAPREFKVPCGKWLLPTVGSLLCILVMKSVSVTTVYRFLVWTGLGQIVYFSYGYRYSKCRQLRKNQSTVSLIELMKNPCSIASIETENQYSSDFVDVKSENEL